MTPWGDEMQFLTVTSVVSPIVFVLSAPIVLAIGHWHGGWGRVLLYSACYVPIAWGLNIVASLVHVEELNAVVMSNPNPPPEVEEAWAGGAAGLGVFAFGWAPGLIYIAFCLILYAIIRAILFLLNRPLGMTTVDTPSSVPPSDSPYRSPMTGD